MPNTHYFIGLISGTSVDGIDAGLFAFSNSDAKLIDHYSGKLPAEIRDEIIALTLPEANEIDRLGALDIKIGALFSEAALNLIKKSAIPASQILAIGSHGQTIRHRPKSENFPTPFTLQIGDPNTIAQQTGICTVADLRRRDMAAGGQGAPLAPAFHEYAFNSSTEKRAVINVGGISNISILGNNTSTTLGYDTGPGNVLMDAWIYRHLGKHYDEDGKWASEGKVNSELLKELLKHEYFAAPPPKSTGREAFNLDWLDKTLNTFATLKPAALPPADVQATLCALTAHCIAEAATFHAVDALYLCGGGAHNTQLINELDKRLDGIKVSTTEALGIHPDWVEAGLCAWIAKQTLDNLPSNLPSVTGASKKVPLGAIYPAG